MVPRAGLQPLALHDIDMSLEQAGDMILDAGILINANECVGIDLDHDVAVGTRVTPRA